MKLHKLLIIIILFFCFSVYANDENKKANGCLKSEIYQNASLLFHAFEACSSQEQVGYINQEDYIVLLYHLEGDYTTTLNGFGEYHASYPQLIITAGPRGMTRMDRAAGGKHQAHVGIAVLRDFLLRQFAGDSQGLPASLRPLLSPRECPQTILGLPLTPALILAVRSVLSVTFENSTLASHYYESKVKELLYLAVDALTKHEQVSTVRSLSRVKQQQLSRVRALISEHIAESLTLDMLAAQVGMSKAVMTAGYKQLFGVSIFENILMERMTTAYRLLGAGCSVTEVTDRVGYRQACNFSSAFKRYYGVSPSDIMASSPSNC